MVEVRCLSVEGRTETRSAIVFFASSDRQAASAESTSVSNDAPTPAFLRCGGTEAVTTNVLTGERGRRALNGLEDVQSSDFLRWSGQAVPAFGARGGHQYARGDQTAKVLGQVRLGQVVELGDRPP